MLCVCAGCVCVRERVMCVCARVCVLQAMHVRGMCARARGVCA